MALSLPSVARPLSKSVKGMEIPKTGLLVIQSPQVEEGDDGLSSDEVEVHSC